MSDHESSFSEIVEDAKCIYASRANIVKIPPLGEDASIEEIAGHASKYFQYVSRSGKDHKIDGVVIQIDDKTVGSTIFNLSNTTYKLLTTLSKYDPQKTNELDRAYEEGWSYKLYDERYFVIVFAPFYPENSPRRVRYSLSTYYMFQPFHAFNRKANPISGLIPLEVRIKIRELYASDNRGYDEVLAASLHDGHKLILPTSKAGEIVSWWEMGREDVERI